MVQKVLYIFVFVFLGFYAQGQEHFLVDIKPLSPPIETLIKSYIGYPAIPIQAKDINGNTQSIAAKKGKAVLMYFWDQNCSVCTQQFQTLNTIQAEFSNRLEIITFSNNSKAENIQFNTDYENSLTIIPNSKILSDGPYQGDFGQPKIFIIDAFGIIRNVYPQEMLEQTIDLKQLISTTLSNL